MPTKIFLTVVGCGVLNLEDTDPSQQMLFTPAQTAGPSLGTLRTYPPQPDHCDCGRHDGGPGDLGFGAAGKPGWSASYGPGLILAIKPNLETGHVHQIAHTCLHTRTTSGVQAGYEVLWGLAASWRHTGLRQQRRPPNTLTEPQWCKQQQQQW